MAGMLQITLPILRNRCVLHLNQCDLSRQKQLLPLLLITVKHRNSKWAVSEEEMPGSHYPDFLSGWSVNWHFIITLNTRHFFITLNQLTFHSSGLQSFWRNSTSFYFHWVIYLHFGQITNWQVLYHNPSCYKQTAADLWSRATSSFLDRRCLGDRILGSNGRHQTCQPQPLLHCVQVGNAVVLRTYILDNLWKVKIHCKTDIDQIAILSSSQLSCCLRSANYSCPFLAGPTDSSPALIKELALHNYRWIVPSSIWMPEPCFTVLPRKCHLNVCSGAQHRENAWEDQKRIFAKKEILFSSLVNLT